MRIIGEIAHEACKITIFKTDMRLIVKFEDSFYEQVFKFRQSDELQGVADIQRMIDAPFIAAVCQRFEQMRQSTLDLWDRFAPPIETIETII